MLAANGSKDPPSHTLSLLATSISKPNTQTQRNIPHHITPYNTPYHTLSLTYSLFTTHPITYSLSHSLHSEEVMLVDNDSNDPPSHTLSLLVTSILKPNTLTQYNTNTQDTLSLSITLYHTHSHSFFHPITPSLSRTPSSRHNTTQRGGHAGRQRQQRSTISVLVIDTGEGITREDQRMIFIPFALNREQTQVLHPLRLRPQPSRSI